MDDSLLPVFLEEADDLLADWERLCVALDKAFEISDLDGLFRTIHTLKGSSRTVGLAEMGALMHEAEEVLSQARKGSLRFDAAAVGVFLALQTVLVDWCRCLVSEPSFVPHAEVATMRRKIASLNGSAQPTPSSAAADASFGFFDDAPSSSPSAQLQQEPRERAATASEQTVRVSAARLDGLMQLVGELATQQAIVWHGRTTFEEQAGLLNAAQLCHKLTKELQLQVLGLRMQPIGGLFQRLERVARDIARDQEKPIDVILEGSQVELDKAVIEKVTEALIHVARNAVDHGVEAASARVAAGKPPHATIRLSAFQEGGGVVLRISDDGRGIALDRLRARAVELGLCVVGREPTAAELYDVLFQPGFSTAAIVTSVSGRGVGLDVARKTVEGLGGTITVESALGAGTTFVVTLPTRVSIMESLTVCVSGLAYVVPLGETAEILDLTAYPSTSVESGRTRVVSVRGRAVTVVDTAAYLPSGRKAEGQGADARSDAPALLVEVAGNTFALRVDAVTGQQSVVVRKLPSRFEAFEYFTGTTILASGEPAMIISPVALARGILGAADSKQRRLTAG